MFRPVRTKSASSEVAGQIKEMIMTGQLHPGDRLPSERELAERLSVSRTTIREALRSLAAVGMISIRQGDGSFVEHFRLEGMLEPLAVMFQIDREESGLAAFSEVRRILEIEMAALAAERARPEDIEQIEKCLGQMVEEVNDGGVGDLSDAAFHLALAHASQNPLLIKLMNTIADLMQSTYLAARKQLFLDQNTLQDIYDSHSAVADAIKAREPQVARNRMREHLELVEREIERLHKQPRQLI